MVYWSETERKRDPTSALDVLLRILSVVVLIVVECGLARSSGSWRRREELLLFASHHLCITSSCYDSGGSGRRSAIGLQWHVVVFSVRGIVSLSASIFGRSPSDGLECGSSHHRLGKICWVGWHCACHVIQWRRLRVLGSCWELGGSRLSGSSLVVHLIVHSVGWGSARNCYKGPPHVVLAPLDRVAILIVLVVFGIIASLSSIVNDK